MPPVDPNELVKTQIGQLVIANAVLTAENTNLKAKIEGLEAKKPTTKPPKTPTP